MVDVDLGCYSFPHCVKRVVKAESWHFPCPSGEKSASGNTEPKAVEWGGRSIVIAPPHLGLSHCGLEFSLFWAWPPYWKMEQFRERRLISPNEGKCLPQAGGKTGVLVYQCGLL